MRKSVWDVLPSVGRKKELCQDAGTLPLSESKFFVGGDEKEGPTHKTIRFSEEVQKQLILNHRNGAVH